MDLISLIGQPENERLEYKAVLPPARALAILIAAFANAEGGLIVLGVHENNSKLVISGLSEDFRANSVTHKAFDLLSPKPTIKYDYVVYQEKRLYVIEVEKSHEAISFEGKIYRRENLQTRLSISDDEKHIVVSATSSEINRCQSKLEAAKRAATDSRSKLLNHYQGILNILATSRNIVSPVSPNILTVSSEGKILMRILFSSCADSFEMFLSDLMYEIYLANPDTLKSDGAQVAVKDVLNCADIQEFVVFWSRKKLSKLQRGSIRGFLDDNEHVKKLKAIDSDKQDRIEKLMQVRHLYSHKNGIVDEKFIENFSNQFQVNQEHQFSLDEFIKNLEFLIDCAVAFDNAAIAKFYLSTIDHS